MKPAAYYRGKEQTYLKHFFVERYLETVAFHIGYSYRAFVYVDCFSGPWRSDDENLADTSIRIALDKLNYVRDGLAKQGRAANIRAVFVEKDPLAFRALSRALEQHQHAIAATALLGTFEDNTQTILQHVGKSFAFFFIDPKGWTGFAMDNIRSILQHHPGEIMLNFMYDFINRFINFPDPATEHSLDQLFGTTNWRAIRTVTDREEASVELYKEQLRKAGAYSYVTSTRILKPLHERAYFHLVYATRNKRGIIEFRDIERQTIKEQDAVRVVAHREYSETKTGQGELLFGPARELSTMIEAERARRLEQARERVLRLIGERPMQYADLQPLVMEIPLVATSDFNHLLLAGQHQGVLVIEGMKARERTPKIGHVIRRA